MKYFKSILFIVVFSFILIFTGCESKNNLVGEWVYPSLNCQYTFRSDGTGSYGCSGITMDFSYVYDDTSFTPHYEDNTSDVTYNYVINGNTLTVTDSIFNISSEYKRK